MMSYKFVKYNVKSSIKSIIIYYSIIICVIVGTALMNKFSGGYGYSSGTETSSIIFLFVLGLNFFKENFYFAQANNISRAEYFKATTMAMLPIGISMAILDVIINRVYNIFGINPTIYDMIYNHSFSLDANREAWIQSNSMQTLFGTVSFLFALYIVAFAIGMFITLIYYKCNKIMKLLVSLSPIAILAILVNSSKNYPEFSEQAVTFIGNIFGLSTSNSYMAVITFICIFTVTMIFVYLFVRKAVVKRV